MEPHPFDSVGRLPLPGDNVAIAIGRLEAGTAISYQGSSFTLDHTVLEGHRFTVKPIAAGEALLSWQLPFGVALRDIFPGSYVCNASTLEALRGRELKASLPLAPNFRDEIAPYELDEARFIPAAPLPRQQDAPSFLGYRRSASRGVGTRNLIVLLGTTSRVGSYVRRLEAQLKGVADGLEHLDGVVAVAHTEGGGLARPNNHDHLMRVLSGFMVHPNVGAVLAVDDGLGVVTNDALASFMAAHGYPLQDVPHHFMTLSGSFAENLKRGEDVVRRWLEEVNRTPRSEAPLSALKIALQCGGSDAFSGVSGNPLASWVAREVIRAGGAANLAETDELIGAEPYVLQKVRDVGVAKRFLETLERFKDWASWHGASAEGNPSGGNKLRGLYNIALKSIGAAMKRHPDVPLDEVIAYGERMTAPGFYFMDSPGNDLESIAGQVASGCNLIFFITGNGSITNFPFVPTLKIVTTSGRYELLKNEMDVNAGAYLDGTPLDELGANMLELSLRVASGEKSAGERAGHAQVQIWRDWQQTGAKVPQGVLEPEPDGEPLPIRAERPGTRYAFGAVRTPRGISSDRVGLILPTSLCAGQVARMTAEHLNRQGLGRERGLSRFVSLVHTEGCGVSGGASEALYTRTLLGYLNHPLVGHCLLLEHGCEKTHNDYLRARLTHLGLDPDAVGWASIQLDGGIDRVMHKIERWFGDRLHREDVPGYETVGLAHLRLGLMSSGPVPEALAKSLAQVTRWVVGEGGLVVAPQGASLLEAPSWLGDTLGAKPERPSLAYGQQAQKTGFHLMETPSAHWVETLTGLGATGVEIVLGFADNRPMQGHPLVPVLQVGTEAFPDTDLALSTNPATWADELLRRVLETTSRQYEPKLFRQGNTDVQFTRGPLGVSL